MNINLIKFFGRVGGVYTLIAAEKSMVRVKKQKKTQGSKTRLEHTII